MTAAALRNYVELAKPRITTLVVFTCASGLWLAPGRLSARTVILTLVGTVLIVAAANVLNMYLERDTDALMKRTMNRPLPAGRMDPQQALRFVLGDGLDPDIGSHQAEGMAVADRRHANRVGVANQVGRSVEVSARFGGVQRARTSVVCTLRLFETQLNTKVRQGRIDRFSVRHEEHPAHVENNRVHQR